VTSRPDYGIDAPGVVRNLALIGVALLLVGVFLPSLTVGPITFRLRGMGLATGVACLAEAGLMLWYARSGKFRHRDRMLALHEWRGDERVLDVGTGRGLLMVGAAHRLSGGRSIGTDVWRASDLSGNQAAAAEKNAALEGVADRCEVRNDDARRMEFPDASFDVVLSNLCLHNIHGAEGRATACREIARVLKPGGIAVISDFIRTREYVAAFRAAGLEVERRAANPLATFPPMAIVMARKPLA
jgi:SAM-dependent methyltransferase